jgi:putative drug exporter of the RND superfamily
VLIRMAVVPALMRMLGRTNWWFPRWADRLVPRMSVEPQTQDRVPDEAHVQEQTGQSVPEDRRALADVEAL